MEAEFTAESVVVAEIIGFKELLGEIEVDCVMSLSRRSTIKQHLSNLLENLRL